MPRRFPGSSASRSSAPWGPSSSSSGRPGVGDVLVGLLALPVAFYLGSGRPGGRAVAYAWNWLGILDLAVALTLGFLSSPTRFQLLALDAPNRLVGAYPLVM